MIVLCKLCYDRMVCCNEIRKNAIRYKQQQPVFKTLCLDLMVLGDPILSLFRVIARYPTELLLDNAAVNVE